MDILIPDLWLREYLQTKATPEEIQKYLSLCGPSVERINKGKTGPVYSIEVTTNRVDSTSVYGIAREAATIFPRFKIPATLQPIEVKSKQKLARKVDYLDAAVDSNLCKRFTAILVRNVELAPSPKCPQEKLEDAGIRPINNVVDISNYTMILFGQPIHIFDYNKIKGQKIILREARKGEKITTLDGKTHTLHGGDIVIEDGSGELIDLAGIMGGGTSAIDKNTRNVLVLVPHYNPQVLRKTSMSLAHRTEAYAFFEKNIDPEGTEPAVRFAIDMLQDLAGGEPENKILDMYLKPYKPKKIEVGLKFIYQKLGVQIPVKEIQTILESLGFSISSSPISSHSSLSVNTPSFRANDISIPEDIVEEVARIYGYHNLPSQLMDGPLPPQPTTSPFEFEYKAKLALKGLGGIEVYTSSLVSQSDVGGNSGIHSALRLKNPLGKDSEYLRESLSPSLTRAIRENRSDEPYWLFEMANAYIPRRGDLPEEKMILAGIFSENFNYRRAKGIVEAFLKEMRILDKIEKHGKFEYLEDGLLYFEFETKKLQEIALMAAPYKLIPKYPPQVEDLTLIVQPRTLIGQIIEKIKSSDPHVSSVELVNIYENTRTLQIYYQHPEKTLTNQDVLEIRAKILKNLKNIGLEVKN